MYRSAFSGRRASRLFALLLALMLVFCAVAPCGFAVMPTPGESLRYIPLALTVDNNAIMVYGYFTNLNPNVAVSNFRDFSMDLYVGNQLIAAGYFGTLESFTIQPLDVLYHTFLFEQKNNYVPGAYICEDDDFAVISCTFDYSELVFVPGGVK